MVRTPHSNTLPQPMPGNVRGALAKRKLMDAFRSRPDYQQRDYLKRIAAANGPTVKQTRLDQMLDELDGGLFNGEPWIPPTRSAPATTRTP